MKERVAPRRLIVPSLLLPALLLAMGCVVFGAGRASAEGDRLFEGERYELAPPPDMWEIPARVTAATIFGDDDRVQVEDTTEWPYRTVTHIVAFDVFGNQIQECSGILLNLNVVLTAAHCVWDDLFDQPFGSLLVIPGEDGFGSEPFGQAGADGLSISIPKGYRETSLPEFDFGLIHLDGHDYGGEVGPFAAVASADDAFFDHPETALFTSGYPGDKPLGTQWWSATYIDYVDSTLIYTLMDAFPGQSGSGIFAVNFESEVAAVVGVYSTEDPYSNQAVRLSDLHIDALHNYCDDAGCSFSSTHLQAPTPAPTPTNTPTPTPTPTKTPPVSPTVSPTSPPGPSQLPFKSRVTYVGRD